MPDTFLEKSVTAADATQLVGENGVLRLTIPFWNGLDAQRISLPPEAPAYYSRQRDVVLRSTVHQEAMWAAAVGIAISRTVSQAWEVKSDIPLRARRAQDLLLAADGRRVGWVGFLAKHLRDYLSTDNGAFVEVVRASKAPGARVIGLKHLDSLKCVRTGDIQYPVIYTDKTGRMHALRDYQVITLCEMPDPGENWNGVGLCAAARSYPAIYKLATIEWYLREKIGGLHPLAIHIVNGLLTNQIDSAIRASKEQEVSRNVAAYMGAVVIGVAKDAAPELVTIPLAEMPDRFNRKEEFDISLLTYADNLGLDPQELQPLSGQSLGTGAQSQVLDDKARGKGLAAWRQSFTHAMQEYVLDERTSFIFIERDYRDQERKASVQKAHADIAKVRIDAGITSAQQELQVMVDADDLPKAFLPVDITPGEALSDTDKPEQAAEEQPATEELPAAEEQPQDADDTLRWGQRADKEQYSGAMVALFVPESFALKLALPTPDALPASDLHITLAFLGDAAAETMDRAAARGICQDIANMHEPIAGVINGQGFFQIRDGSSTAAYAHFLTYDAPALPAFRQRLIEMCKARGILPVENHGFVPHITLVYNETPTPPDIELPTEPVLMPGITLAWGDEREFFPFRVAEVKEARPTDQHRQEAAALLARAGMGSSIYGPILRATSSGRTISQKKE